MNSATSQALLRLNRAFYERFADEFARSRTPEQPGWQRLLAYLPEQGRVLDVGCGHGRLARLLDQQRRRVIYVGVDSSPQLLAIARSDTADLTVPTALVEADVTAPGWIERLPAGHFDAVVALALLHHIPGRQGRRDLLAQLAGLLAEEGVLALSTWQFMNEARLLRKIVPWSAAGLTPDDVEPGDFLLDWRRGGLGLRYCHLVDESELTGLASQVGLAVEALFQDDGQARNLNLFAVLRRPR